MTRTTQKTGIEKAKERLEMVQKADKDNVLFWHLETIREELKEEAQERQVI